MKKIILITLTLTLIFSLLSGCDLINYIYNQNQDTVKTPKNFMTSDNSMKFTFPYDWDINSNDNPFDLQCFSKDNSMNTGVFVFYQGDLAEDITPEHILDMQIEDLKSKRDNFEIIEDINTQVINDKKITTVTYSGEKDVSKDYYSFSLLQFANNNKIFAVILQVCIPSKWNVNKPVLNEIISSAYLENNL